MHWMHLMRFVCILPSFCIVLRSHALYFCLAYLWCSGAKRFLLIFYTEPILLLLALD